MNWIEYAIARTAAQLRLHAAMRSLTEVECCTLDACQARVNLLEIRESVISLKDQHDQTAPRYSADTRN